MATLLAQEMYRRITLITFKKVNSKLISYIQNLDYAGARARARARVCFVCCAALKQIIRNCMAFMRI
jgi:hypothetical protein